MSVLCGEFISLRNLTPSDAQCTFDWRQSNRAKLLNAGAATVEEQAAWIARRPANERNFIIERNDTKTALGMLALVGIDSTNRHAESGRFLIGDESAAKGVPAAVEAMKLLYELAFEELDLLRIFGTIAANNRLMIKWQKFLGMKEEGCLRQHYFIGGAFQDAIILGLLKEEYYKVARPRMDALIAAARH